MRLSSKLRLSSRKQTVDRRPARRRLEVELLEDRALLSGTTFLPVVEASIQDEPPDGQGDSFNTVFDGLMRQGASIENRAIVEFDLASASTDPVDLAVLDFRLAVNSQGTPLRTFDVYVYAGNGARDLTDFSAAGTKVGTVILIGAEGGDDYRLDVTSAVRDLLGGGSPTVGVRVDPAHDQTPSLFLDAKLTINGAPAPTGMRSWESVPNAILMDGVDSFHLEVDVGGAVNSVTLDPDRVLLVPPAPGTLVLRDDGLDGDRVAGDFIYTTGAFRYNTSVTMPNFYQDDPDNPAGIHIVDVGQLIVEELDGSVSPFLVWPEVGLVRADLPLAPAVDVAPNIVATEHLINISTDAHATQRSLRGPAIVMYQVTSPIYQQFRDTADFFMFFSTNKVEQLPSRTTSANFITGRHIDVKVDYTGSSRPLSDNTAFYGSDGRLQGVNLLDAYERGIWSANATHELVHQWSAHIDPALGVSDFGGHYNGRSSAGSLVGGFQWTPNGDGSYTINYDEGRNGATHASEIDLYMMGLLDPSEVDPILAYSGPSKPFDNPIVQASEITTTVTIDDIIARHGPRTPGPDAAQRDFNLAFVAESHNRLLTPVELTFYEILAAHYTKPVPEGQPDPRLGFGWQSIDRFFGHGTTWSSAAPPLRRLTVDIVDVAPDPRATAVSQISIVFNDPATGFDLGDLRLTRDGGGNLLTGAETLSSTDNITWTVSGLSGLTGALGNYELTLVASGSGIQGPDGKPLVAGAVERWSRVPALVTLSVDASNPTEGATASITATLSNVLDTDVSVALAFSGTAALDADYTRSATQLTITAGQTQASLTLTALQDALDEDDKTVIVDIVSVTNAIEDGTQQVTATITDDDPLPSLSISDATAVVEGGPGARPELVFVMQLSAPSGRIVAADFATAPGTATSGVDYVPVNTTVYFGPGATSHVVRVQVIGDAAPEADETLTLVLANPQNATLADDRGVATILDDEPVIDVKPGDSTNRINLTRESTIRVAILSVAGFDAPSAVAVNSLRFGRTGTEDSLVRSKKGVAKTEILDVNGDGRLDLVAYFDTVKTGLRVGDTQATLRGTLTNGMSFISTALVEIIASGRGNGKG